MKYLQIIIILILVIGILGLWHWSVYHMIRSSIGLTLWQSHMLTRSLIWLTASFILMSVLVSTIYSQVWSWLYTASAVWMGTLYWLVIASILFVIISMINTYTWWTISTSIVWKVLIIIAIIISIYGVRNSNQTQIVHYTVPMKNLPASWQGKKIAMIADTHVWVVRNIWLLHRIRPQIEWQWVEMLLVSGDFRDGLKANDQELAQALAEINTPYGTYFAPGNHEEYGNLNNYLHHLTDAWIHVLNNEATTVNGLQLIGVDYSSTHSTTGFVTMMDKLTRDRSQPSILIKHVPSHAEIVDQFGIDLQVAWHVHQWQVWPGYFFAHRVFGAFAYGLNRIGKSWIITTSGVGTRWPPQRVGTHSEIVIITLTKK